MRHRVTLCLAVAAALLASSASANQPVQRKSGLWEIAVTTAGQPTPFASEVCIDQATDDVARSAGTAAVAAECSESSVTREGDRYLVRSVCPMRSSTVTSEAVLTGSFDSAYEGQIEANYSPPLYGRSQVKSTVQARRIGACK